MNGVVFIQNLIAPYRAHLFNSLFKKDKGFEVYYMGTTEKDRNWDVSKIVLLHPYWLDKKGLYFMVKGLHIHINPVLVFKAAFGRKVKEIVLGVSYNDLNILALTLLKRLRLTKVRFHCWAEANYLTIGARKDSSIKKFVRKFVYSTIDGYFIVPGEMSVKTFERWGFTSNKYIFLPNTIDEKELVYRPNKEKDDQKRPTLLMPVRLIENVKGVLHFFQAIGIDNIKKVIFVIAGDGPDVNRYNQFVRENELQDHIKLLGFCEPDVMNELYNSADGFVLPSFSDPSPLSVVEALRYHLPILCSAHCGNHYEAVKDGINGFIFSPFDASEIKKTFELFLSERPLWKKMGESSWKIYENTFDTMKVVDNFIEAINS